MEETLSTTATAKSELTKVGIKEIFFKYLRFLPCLLSQLP
jgi:hypothetical protein